MKLWARLGMATFAAVLVSILAGGISFVLLREVDANEYGGVKGLGSLSGEWRSRIRAEEIANATAMSLKVAVVLVPLTVLVAWWRSRRR
jgi:hypothetical protein